MLRKLTAEEVTFTLTIEQESERIRGSFDSGDEEADEAQALEIERQLDNGSVWAWCVVRVTASWGDFEASEYLGACSYANEAEFCAPDGYWPDMKGEALDALNARIAEAYATIAPLVENVARP